MVAAWIERVKEQNGRRMAAFEFKRDQNQGDKNSSRNVYTVRSNGWHTIRLRHRERGTKGYQQDADAVSGSLVSCMFPRERESRDGDARKNELLFNLLV